MKKADFFAEFCRFFRNLTDYFGILGNNNNNKDSAFPIFLRMEFIK